MILHPNILAFLAVKEFSTVSAAAQSLSLTQTGVSQRIKSLEREVGFSLFTRSRMGMRLTAEGESFFRYCLEARGVEGRMAAELRRAGKAENVDLTLVAPANMISSRIARQCRPIFAQWPALNFRLQIEIKANRLNQLKRGAADLAILLKNEVTPELDSKLLKPLEFILLGTSKWKRRPLKDIIQNERLFAYHPGDPTGLDYLKEFGLLDELRRTRLFVNENQVLQSLIAEGVGFGLLTRELATPLISSGKVVVLNGGASLKMEMALAWYRRNQMPDYFREIVRLIK